MTTVAYSLGLGALQAISALLYWLTERWNAPWLPWFRRYISLAPLAVSFLVSARMSVPWWLLLPAPFLLNWNTITAARNRRNGKRPKPGPSLGASLTAVQTMAMRREAKACR